MAKTKFNYEKANELVMTPSTKKLITVGAMMERDVKESMVSGTGKVYMKGANRDITHQASAPGSPPAVDTGRLRASISHNFTESGMSYGRVDSGANSEDGVGSPERKSKSEFTLVVGTRVDYAPFLEFGTSKMAPRPFLRPVFEKYRSLIEKLIRDIQKGG